MESLIHNRVNWKTFKDTVIPDEHIAILDQVVELCPVQRNDMPVAQLFKCGKSDALVKEKLSRYVFKNTTTDFENSNTGYWEIAPMTAPLVYFCIADQTVEDFVLSRQQLHAGIVGGALMAQAMHLGYDFSFIGCQEDPSAEQKEIIRATILERFDTDIGANFLNFLAFCIGEADTSPDYEGNYELADGTSVPFRNQISQDPAKPTVLIS